MKRSLTLMLLLATMLVLASCGEDAGQAERPASPEPQTQEATTPGSADEEANRDETAPETAPEEAASEEAATEGADPADNGATEAEPAAGSEQEDPSGLVVTTIGGEEVGIGQGEVTALFFMAGW